MSNETTDEKLGCMVLLGYFSRDYDGDLIECFTPSAPVIANNGDEVWPIAIYTNNATLQPNTELGDARRWRIERKNGDVLRNMKFAYFTGDNGYFLPDRCEIGNMAIGHMIRVDGNAIFRVS